jgi:hypothetical protein
MGLRSSRKQDEEAAPGGERDGLEEWDGPEEREREEREERKKKREREREREERKVKKKSAKPNVTKPIFKEPISATTSRFSQWEPEEESQELQREGSSPSGDER